MPRARWQHFPSAVLREQEQEDAATAWGNTQRDALATEWGRHARAEVDAVVKAYGSSLQPQYTGQLVDDPAAPNAGYVNADELPPAPEPSEPEISIHNPFTGKDESHRGIIPDPITAGMPGFAGSPFFPATKPPPDRDTHKELSEGDADLGEIGQREAFNTVSAQGQHLPAAGAGNLGAVGAVDDAVPGLKSLLREGPGVATKAAQAVESVGKVVGEAVQPVAQKARRFFHGAGQPFETPDPGKFDPTGQYGGAYYVTSDPRVASDYARVRASGASALDQMDTANPEPIGANLRAVDVPDDLRLFDAAAKAESADVERIRGALSQLGEQQGDPLYYLRRFAETLTPGVPTNQQVYDGLAHAFDALPNAKGRARDFANTALGALGYDGVKYQGGKRVPLLDDSGSPIEHDAIAVFPQALPKVRNGLSGQPMGAFAGVTAEENEQGETEIGFDPVQAAFGVAAGSLVDRYGNPTGRGKANDAASPLVTASGAPARVVQEVVRTATRPAKEMIQSGVDAARAMPPEHRTVVKTIKAESAAQKWIDRGQAIRYGSMLADWVARVNDTATGLLHTVERPLEDVLAGYPRAGGARVAGIVSGIPDAAAAFLNTLKTGDPKFSTRREGTESVRPFGNSIPGRAAVAVTDFMAAADDFVKSLNYNGSLYANAQKQAKRGDAETLLANPSPELMARAERDAQIATYTEEPGALPKWLSEGRQLPGIPGLAVSLAIPFMRVGANIAQRGIQRTARGVLVPGLVEAAVKAANGDGEAARYALAKTAIASGLATVFVVEAVNGHLKGSLPEKPGERKLVQAKGQRDNSWNVLGSGRYVDLGQLGDVGAQAIIIANTVGGFMEGRADGPWRGIGEELTTADWEKMAPEILEGIAEGVSDINYLQGLARFFTKAPGQGFGDAAKDEVAGLAASAIPAGAALNRAGKATDSLVRDTKGQSFLEDVGNRVKARIPKNPLTPDREDLPARQDVLGRDVANDEQGMWVGLKGGLAKEDAVIDEILNVGASIGDPPKDVKLPESSARVALTPAEQRRYRTVAGERIQEAVKRAMTNETYKRQAPASKKKIVSDAIEKARAAAGLTVLQEMGSPEISRRLRAAKPAA